MLSVLTATVGLACSSLVVNTTLGQVEGRTDEELGTQYFYGIPFGKAERFAPPTDQDRWNGVKKLGMTQPPSCPQAHLTKDIWFGQEDCLTIDIWRPGGLTGGENLPVMVWVFGGGFVIGSDDQVNIYNGKKIAKNFNTIVVAMNYRVDNLGFLALNSLFAEHNTTGNYGLLDQQLALKWVQQNIASFGGNPASVELFGQSAGGCSVVAQLAMPSSKGLFSSAAIESSLPVSNVMWVSKKNAVSFGEVFASHVGCPESNGNQISCLRNKPLEEILNALLEWRHDLPKTAGFLPSLMPIMTWWPTIDGSTLPYPPVESVQKGIFTDVPTIMGTVQNEGSIFAPGMPLIVNSTLDVPIEYPITSQGWQRSVEHFFGKGTSNSGKIVSFYESVYPKPSVNSTMYYSNLTADLIRDLFFICPARFLQRNIASSPTRKSPIFAYHFSQNISSYLYDAFGDYHTSEIPYVHNLVDEWRKWKDDEVSLSLKMAGYWTSLAAGDAQVTCPTCPQWRPFTMGDQGYMSFATPTGMKVDLMTNVCDFWDTIGYESVV
eukprot:TRINITY_DN984_c0_g5_i1.p1 TRINITY_DN984_c0_g5~~TRINITY_DN984_c0_g5_i1.p1  ORF type:complete len:547 (+),score=32.44 TRINITY_DN984_c0_g5_i1:52-1692(+)